MWSQDGKCRKRHGSDPVFDKSQLLLLCGNGNKEFFCSDCTESEPSRCNSKDCSWDEWNGCEERSSDDKFDGSKQASTEEDDNVLCGDGSKENECTNCTSSSPEKCNSKDCTWKDEKCAAGTSPGDVITNAKLSTGKKM